MWTLKLQLLTVTSTDLCQEGLGCRTGKVTGVEIEMLLGHSVEDSAKGEI